MRPGSAGCFTSENPVPLHASHCESSVSDTTLANLVGLSQFHFIRTFKSSVGLSPYQYVLSERISVAKELLLKRDLSIADVALAVGFSDASQLNRAFLKLTEIAPTFFRRENGLLTESKSLG